MDSTYKRNRVMPIRQYHAIEVFFPPYIDLPHWVMRSEREFPSFSLFFTGGFDDRHILDRGAQNEQRVGAVV